MKYLVKLKAMKTIIAVSCLTLLLTMNTLLGCGKTEAQLTFPTAIDELSLVQVGEELLEKIDCQEVTTDLRYMSLRVTDIATLELLSFAFYGTNDEGKPKYYHVDVTPRGELWWYSYDLDTNALSETLNNPLEYFEELDNVGLANIGSNGSGYSILIGFQWGDFGDNHDYFNIYHLKEGELIPLSEIIFHTDIPVGTITVYKSGVAELWFITSDVDKATVVDYL